MNYDYQLYCDFRRSSGGYSSNYLLYLLYSISLKKRRVEYRRNKKIRECPQVFPKNHDITIIL